MPRRRHRALRPVSGGLLAFALGGLLYASPALAVAGDCTTSNVNHGNTNGQKLYRINSVSFDLLPAIGRDPGANAVVMGADVWNEEGTAGYFQLGPSTSDTDLPANKADCDAQGINYSLVLVEDIAGAKGSTSGRCVDATGRATQFVISIRTQDSLGYPWNWSVGTISAGEWDLVQTLAHEFGHTMRLGHPANGEAATMTPTSQSTNRVRDLYQWDLKCLSEISGRRQLTGYRRLHSGTTFGAETATTGASPIVHLSSGVTKYTGGWQWSTAFARNDCTAWQPNFDNTKTQCTSVPQQVGIGPRTAVFREDETMDRIFYSNYTELPTPYAADGKHPVQYNRSSDGFVTRISGSLSHCSAMSGFFTCSGTTPVYSGKPVAVAWDVGNSRAIFAWANQTRLNDSQERRVKVAVGFINNLTLPQPDDLPVQSSIGPAVACTDGTANAYSCIVAYTDQNSTLADLRVRRFTPVAGANRYSLSVDPTTHFVLSNVRTASSVAAWYNQGRFWLLVRPIRTSQNLEAYSSTDGATWTSAGSYGYSAVGPTAASYWSLVNNTVGYAR